MLQEGNGKKRLKEAAADAIRGCVTRLRAFETGPRRARTPGALGLQIRGDGSQAGSGPF